MDRFARIPKGAIDDSSLSWGARGLLLFLLSKPDHWEVMPDALVNCGTLGRDGVYSLLKELREAGYLVMVRRNGGGVDYELFDAPTSGNSGSGKSGEAVSGNSARLVTTETAVTTEQEGATPRKTRNVKKKGEPPELDLYPGFNLKNVTVDAIETFNESELVTANGGPMPGVKMISFDTRLHHVAAGAAKASAICQDLNGSPAITREFWKQYWESAAQDDFTGGRTGGAPGSGHENWRANFEYLTKGKTMERVYEKATA